MHQEIRFCTAADGARIAYATLGEGPPLVKAANWLNHLEYDLESPLWQSWFRALSRDHKLVRYDERGCGLSDWNAEDYSLEAWVRDLEAVVDAAGVERFPLLGMSQGGPVAIAYAVRHPERVTHLLLYGTYARGWTRRGLSPEQIAEHEALITLTERGWGRDVPVYREVFTRTFIPDASEEQRNWFNDLQGITTSPKNAVRLQRAVGMIDVSDLLPKLTIPTLVLHARGDLRCPFEEGRLVAASISGSRFVSLDSRNHLLLEHEPAWHTFVHEVRAFLGVPGRVSDSIEPARRGVEMAVAQPQETGAPARARPYRSRADREPARSPIGALKERKLVQWVLVYLAAAWLTLQVLDVLQGAWAVPVWLVRAIQVILGLGLLVTLVVAWYHGEKGEQRVTGPELVIIAVLLVVAALLLRVLVS
ncbi:MAG: alpha/beta hydrolase [Gemmatimonadetes bacterium]|nr:alpha/beta hydrolase [Gemmatimonadota bacterium]